MPTSATDRSGVAGFTLVELLVVMTIGGLLLAMVPAATQRAGGRARLEAAATGVASALALARSQAILTNRPAHFFLDVAGRRYGVGSGESGTIASDLSIDIEAADGLGAIRFHPNGQSDGGLIRLGNATGAWTIRVDWLTGRIHKLRAG